MAKSTLYVVRIASVVIFPTSDSHVRPAPLPQASALRYCPAGRADHRAEDRSKLGIQVVDFSLDGRVGRNASRPRFVEIGCLVDHGLGACIHHQADAGEADTFGAVLSYQDAVWQNGIRLEVGMVAQYRIHAG